MERLTLNAPAKINIGLNIVSKRLDGFHNLETFFYPIYNLYDTLVFEKSTNFVFDSNNNDLIRDPDNLILKAHSLIEDLAKKKLPVKITLIKKIPIGAGLGGGSSDAAATLLGLNEMFNLEIGITKLNELALKLGSDVPYFIKSKPAVGYSRGEILTQSNTYIESPILIVNPGIHISTKDAFSNITPHNSNFDYQYFLQNEKLDYTFLSNGLTNDFENYVFYAYPEIGKIKNTMLKFNAMFSLMSGTGSTVYGIFNDIEDAKNVASSLPTEYYKFISEGS
jgi:4-diphosphocytidyl-2-C-methyl-D-erythritol kinase